MPDPSKIVRDPANMHRHNRGSMGSTDRTATAMRFHLRVRGSVAWTTFVVPASFDPFHATASHAHFVRVDRYGAIEDFREASRQRRTLDQPGRRSPRVRSSEPARARRVVSATRTSPLRTLRARSRERRGRLPAPVRRTSTASRETRMRGDERHDAATEACAGGVRQRARGSAALERRQRAASVDDHERDRLNTGAPTSARSSR